MNLKKDQMLKSFKFKLLRCNQNATILEGTVIELKILFYREPNWFLPRGQRINWKNYARNWPTKSHIPTKNMPHYLNQNIVVWIWRRLPKERRNWKILWPPICDHFCPPIINKSMCWSTMQAKWPMDGQWTRKWQFYAEFWTSTLLPMRHWPRQFGRIFQTMEPLLCWEALWAEKGKKWNWI